MPTPALTDELAEEAVKALGEHGTAVRAAAALNIPRGTFRNRMKRAAERGMLGFRPVLPGYAVKAVSSKMADGSWVRQTKEPGEVFETPAGHSVKGVSALVDADGRTVQQWIKTKAEPDPADVVETIKAAFADWKHRAAPLARPDADEDLATVHLLPDLHLGLLCYGREVGTNWDLKIAEREIGGAIERMIAGAPASGLGIVLGLGDLMHADGYEAVTPTSRHPLDVDGRWPRVLKSATQLIILAVDAALRRHGRVLVRILSGNHDIQSSIAVALALSLYYRNEPRVTVDDDPSYFWWHLFGNTLLGGSHGDAAKMRDIPLIMASRNAEAWGRSKYRMAFTGHVHHQSAIELSGVTVESFQAPVPSDAYHHKAGYGGGRSLTSITIHKARGEIARNKVNIA